MIKTIFQNALTLYRKHLRVLLGVYLIAALPSLIIEKNMEKMAERPAMMGAILLVNFLFGLIWFGVMVLVYFMVGQGVMGRDTSFDAVWQAVKERLGMGIKVVLYTTFKVMTGFLMGVDIVTGKRE